MTSTPFSSRHAPSDRFWWGATAVLLLGIALRQWALGDAPFHPDEAIHAFFSGGFATYHYDPVYHGPLLYHLVSWVFDTCIQFHLGGQSDFSARLVPSLFGIGLLGLVLGPARQFLGARGALASAALLAVSPSLVSYSRRLLHDSLALFLTKGAVLCFVTALESPAATRRGRASRVGLAAFLTLFLATKANCFFIMAMLAAFYIAWRGAGRLRLPVALEKWVPALLFALVSVAAIARPNSFIDHHETPDHRFFKVVALLSCAAFGLWLLTRRVADDSGAPCETPLSAPNAPPKTANFPSETITTYVLSFAAALWIYVFLFGQAAQVFIGWKQTGHFPTQVLFDGAASARSALPRMIGYWGGQQGNPRLPGRHDYYFVLMLLYEVPILLAALGGLWHASKHRSTFTDLLLWWAFSSWTVYALANEKVPWLVVHIALPLALLGGVWLGQLRWKKPVLALATLLGLGFSLRGVSGVNFERGADHAEPMLYAQTTDAFRDVFRATLEQTRGDTRGVWLSGERQWPTVWYLRAGAPEAGGSGAAIEDKARAPVPADLRAAVADEGTPHGWVNFQAAGWRGQKVDFLIWPRASWTAIEPNRFWRWFWSRDALPQTERPLPQTQWKLSILGGAGEWSHATTFVTRP